MFATHDELGLRLPAAVLAEVADVPYAANGAPYERVLPHVTDQHVDAVALAGALEEVTARVAALKSSASTASPSRPMRRRARRRRTPSGRSVPSSLRADMQVHRAASVRHAAAMMATLGDRAKLLRAAPTC